VAKNKLRKPSLSGGVKLLFVAASSCLRAQVSEGKLKVSVEYALVCSIIGFEPSVVVMKD